jgi:hypothetical protein
MRSSAATTRAGDDDAIGSGASANGELVVAGVAVPVRSNTSLGMKCYAVTRLVAEGGLVKGGSAFP